MPRRMMRIAALVTAICAWLASFAQAAEFEPKEIARGEHGVLYSVGQQRLLVLYGDHYQMGLQHGKFLPAEAREDIEGYLAFSAQRKQPLEKLLAIYRQLEPHIPKPYLDEMRGLAEGAGVSLDQLHAVHAIPERFHCSGAAVFGKATVDGKLYHTRSLDYSLDIGQQKKVQKNSLVIVYKPDQGNAHVVLSWAGFVGCVSGMNEKGISIGEMGSRCKDESFEGIPMIFMLREALRRANTLDEALTFVREAKRTCGYNFIFADGKIPDAAAIEVTRSLFRAMRWNDPEGNTPPHSLIECAVRRVNHFVSPALAATQREVYDPAKSVAPSWIGYRLISDFITNNYGRLNDSKMIEMLRMYPPEHSCLHQAVFCPSDGVFWASMADDPAQVQFAGAQNQTFYRYDLKAILENRPFKALANKNPRSVLAQQPGLMEEGTVTAEQEVYRAQPNTEQFVPPSKTFKWKMVTIEQQPAYNAYLVTFLSPLESPFPCNNTVYGEYYRPNIKGKIPAVVVLHIAGGDFELSRFISRQLASNGIGALFIQMAYYGYRRPQGDRHVRMLSEDMDFTRDAVRQTVMDVRRAGVWLSLRPEVDSQKVGIVGASLGALVGSLVAGVDPRFQRNAFVLGGGDLAKIIWEGGETVREKKTLEEKGYTLESLRGKVKDVDPLTYAKNINPKGVLMINARFDTVIPPDCTTQLWKAMGEPTILWYDANHVNMLAYLFEVMNKVTEHFSAKNW